MNRLEYGANEMNYQFVREYTIQNDSTPRLGFTVIMKTDNSNMELEFNLNLAISQPRELKGTRDTHKWKVFQDIGISKIKGRFTLPILHVTHPVFRRKNSLSVLTFLHLYTQFNSHLNHSKDCTS